MDNKINFCGKCGTPLSENSKFCPKCGAPVSSNKVSDGSKADLNQNNENKITATEKKNRKKKILLIYICSFLGIAIVLFGLAMMFGEGGDKDISQALLGKDYMERFLKENNFTKVTDTYYESSGGGTMVGLDANGVPESVLIGESDIALFDIRCGDKFSFETVGGKLTSNGYMYQDSNEDSVMYRTEFPGGYKEIILTVDGDQGTINSIRYSVYILVEVETEEELQSETEALSEGEIANPGEESLAGETQQNLAADQDMINMIFPVDEDTVVSWYSEQAGYYMIPCPEIEEKYFVLFSCENSNAKAAQEYYMEVTSIASTEYGGIVCKGPLYNLFEPGADATAVVQIVWESLETIDFPTISVWDGNQFTDVSVIADDYCYSGPIEDYGYNIPVWKDKEGNESSTEIRDSFSNSLLFKTNDGREPDKSYPFLTDVTASSDSFEFRIDRAWATNIIMCPEEEVEYFGSKQLSPLDDNAIFYIVEFTFTNISNKAIEERPIIRLVDSLGITYKREEDITLYTKYGGTSPDYVVYDEGVELDNPMTPGLSIKGVCTFLIAKDWLDENGYITCSLPQIGANSMVECLTGVNLGVEEEISIPLNIK